MIVTGGPDDETLTGTSADHVIDGGGGADTMTGLAGNDRYYVDDAGDQVIEAVGGDSDNVYASVSYTLAAGQEVEFLQVYGAAGLTLGGNEFANYLIGGSGSDTLDGGSGDDTLDGRLGADAMAGGSGNDIYYVDDAGDQVIEAAGAAATPSKPASTSRWGSVRTSRPCASPVRPESPSPATSWPAI